MQFVAELSQDSKSAPKLLKPGEPIVVRDSVE